MRKLKVGRPKESKEGSKIICISFPKEDEGLFKKEAIAFGGTSKFVKYLWKYWRKENDDLLAS